MKLRDCPDLLSAEGWTVAGWTHFLRMKGFRASRRRRTSDCGRGSKRLVCVRPAPGARRDCDLTGGIIACVQQAPEAVPWWENKSTVPCWCRPIGLTFVEAAAHQMKIRSGRPTLGVYQHPRSPGSVQGMKGVGRRTRENSKEVWCVAVLLAPKFGGTKCALLKPEGYRKGSGSRPPGPWVQGWRKREPQPTRPRQLPPRRRAA